MKKVQLDQLKGDELKTLLEQIHEDGKVNTMPELFAFLDGVPEGMTLKDYITSIAGTPDQVPDNSVGTEQIKDKSIELDDLSDDVAATHDDLDEIFGSGSSESSSSGDGESSGSSSSTE